jgi:hypothetical protein
LDKKAAKLSDYKKKHADSEVRVFKLKSTLENVKTFLKLLNSNFIKGIKQQNATLKDQINSSEKDFSREIEAFKASLGPQIMKLVTKKENELQTLIQAESLKASEL